jgi:hypothetical protein
MKTRKITSFISSENRQTTDTVYNFTIDYPDGILTCRENEYMELNVLSFDMPNNMYNINNTNNQFQIILNNTNSTKTFNIPSGNYSVKSLMVAINNLIKGNAILSESVLYYEHYVNSISLTVRYNEAQNTYTIIPIYTIRDVDLNTMDDITGDIPKPTIYFRPTTMGKLVGLQNNIQYTISNISGFTTGLIDLIDYNKVIVHTDNISYYYSNIENIATKSNKQFLSNIIFWKSKADVLPYQVIKYNNEDGGNSFNYRIENREINSLILELKNERGEYILDAPDYLIVIQYIFTERDETNRLLKSIDYTMTLIYDALLFSMNRLKLLL